MVLEDVLVSVWRQALMEDALGGAGTKRKKVRQFREGGRYVAVVVDGKVKPYDQPNL